MYERGICKIPREGIQGIRRTTIIKRRSCGSALSTLKVKIKNPPLLIVYAKRLKVKFLI